ncbi:hypothetical protein BDV25DRAFT_3244 [Aspergillus avenaceus]|uniref:Uncharacterized protein n=1 Tax=Aspergillus avenaceus TaxID=36643 RepID=A0A5N6TSN2_ASPAV|nr:hypothetical protein BDV25DRAFT_3244 [Aspergillus avenaceus]
MLGLKLSLHQTIHLHHELLARGVHLTIIGSHFTSITSLLWSHFCYTHIPTLEEFSLTDINTFLVERRHTFLSFTFPFIIFFSLLFFFFGFGYDGISGLRH